MRALRLMADYQCFPLWEDSPGKVGNLDPAALDISEGLLSRLKDWAARFDATLDLDDPMNSGFSSQFDEQEFANEGRSLSSALQRELGSEFTITYG